MILKIAVTLFICFYHYPLFAQDLTARQIVQRANDVLNQENMFARVKLTITTTSGKKRNLFYDSWSKNKGEKNLIRYTAPRRIKGQAILMLHNADDIWSYDPRTNRVRKLATHAKKQKMQGSDFSYEDLGSGNGFINDFTHRRITNENREGHHCFVVELTLKEGKDSNYSRLVAWIDKKSFVMWAIDYYDEKDHELLIKTLVQSSVELIDNVPTARKITMYNRLDDTATNMELQQVSYAIEIDDELFTERGLKK